MIGKPFSELTVIKRASKQGGSKNSAYWLCSCSCGNETIVSTGNLRAGLVKSCGCLKHRKGADNPNWDGHKELSKSLWSSINRHAKDRNLKVKVTIEQAWNCYEKQGRKCALSGVPISFDLRPRSGNTTASLDRIDSTKGYTIDNIQWVHKDVNLMKLDMDQKEFIKWCKTIAQYQQ